VKNLSLKNAIYIEHERLRDSTIFFTFFGYGFFFAIELGNFKTKGAVWGSFHTENCISNFV
jgi:hypothetical protein